MKLTQLQLWIEQYKRDAKVPQDFIENANIVFSMATNNNDEDARMLFGMIVTSLERTRIKLEDLPQL